MELATLDRAALQALAKQHGIKANLRTSSIIAQLEAVVVVPSPLSSSAASTSKRPARRSSDSSITGRPQRRSPTKATATTRPRTRKSLGTCSNYIDDAMDQDTNVSASNVDGEHQREQRSFASDALPVMATARASLPDVSTPASTISRKRKSWDGAAADLELDDDAVSPRRRSRQRTMEPVTPLITNRRSRSLSRQRSKSEDSSDASDVSFEFSESPGDDSADSAATTPEKDSPPLEVKTLPEDLDLVVFKLASDIDADESAPSEPVIVAPSAPARPTTSGLRLGVPSFKLDQDLTDLVDSFPVCVPRSAQTLAARMGWEIGKFPWTSGSHVEHTSIVAHDAREQLREQAMHDLLDDLRERRDCGQEHSGDVDLELLCASGTYFDPQPNRIYAAPKERKPIERMPLTSLPHGALRYVVAKSRFGRHYASTAHPWNRSRGAIARAVTAERAELRAIRLEAGLDPDALCAPGHDVRAAAEVLSAYPAPDYSAGGYETFEGQPQLHDELAFALGQIPEQQQQQQQQSAHDDDMEEVVVTGFEEQRSSTDVEDAANLMHDEDADADGEWEYETGAEWTYTGEPMRDCDGDRSGSSSPSSSSEPDVEDEHAAAHMSCTVQHETQPRKEMVTYTLPTMPMCASACSSASQDSVQQQQQQQQSAMEIDSAVTFGFQQANSTEQAQPAVQQSAYPFDPSLGYEWTESSFSVGQTTTQTQPLSEQEFFQDFFTQFNVDALNAQVQQQGINPQLTQLNPASGSGYFQPQQSQSQQQQQQQYGQFLPAQQYLPTTTTYEYFGSDVPPPTPRAVGETAHEPFGFDLATLHQQQTHDMDMMQLDMQPPHHPHSHEPEQDEWVHACEAEEALAEQGLFAPAIPEHHVAPAVFAQRTTAPAAGLHPDAAAAGWAAHLVRSRIRLLTGPTRVGVPRPYPAGPLGHPNARDPALRVLGRACERDGEAERNEVGLALWCGCDAGVWDVLETRRREGRACASAAGWRGAPFGGVRGVPEMVDMGGFAHGV
ncbi:hypothetical protein BKA62DRAFT_769751 [Auriculariales sp. MPI-PUGE-AT-0066]|nr:hypothetical protein BKA62DRAFT_769751 [Auriculariales sp. MPI-PUGE-AT-0066]